MSASFLVDPTPSARRGMSRALDWQTPAAAQCIGTGVGRAGLGMGKLWEARPVRTAVECNGLAAASRPARYTKDWARDVVWAVHHSSRSIRIINDLYILYVHTCALVTFLESNI